MIETIEKLSEKDCITFAMTEDGIKIIIRYPKKSTLKRRFEIIDKFKEILHKI